MEPKIFSHLIDLLEPHLDETQRRTPITRAFRTTPIYANIDWTGSARTFTVRLLEQLERYGTLQIDDDTVRPAVAHLLMALYPQVGADVQAEINALLVEMGEPTLSPTSSRQQGQAVDPSQPAPLTHQNNRNGIFWLLELSMGLVISVWATYLIGYLDTFSKGLLIFSLFGLALLIFLSIHKLPASKRLWQFLHQQPHWLWFALIGSLLLIAIPFGLVRSAMPEEPLAIQCPADKHCVLLATFTPEENETAQKTTIDTLARLSSIVENGQKDFVVLPIGPIESEAQAQEVAQAHNALLVVWGYVLTTAENEQIFNFTLTNRLGLDGANSIRPIRLLPLHYERSDELACKTACITVAGKGEIDGRLTTIAHATRGMLHYALEEFAAAQREFSQALEIDAVIDGVDSPLCDLASVEKRDPSETADSEKWQPELLRYYLGRTLAFQGHYEAALQQFHTVVAHNPDDPAVWVAMALACRGWLGPASVIDITPFWQQALDHTSDQPDSAPHHFNRAIIHELQGEWSAARAAYGKALNILDEIEDAATTYAARIARARTEAKLDAPKTAAVLLNGAIYIDDKALWAYLEMARLYLEDKRHVDRWLAKANQSTASRQYPGKHNIQLTKADICRARQDFACAEDAYKLALDHSPPSGWLHTRLGELYHQQEKWGQALEQYQEAAQLRDRDPQAYANLGYFLVANNNFQDAAEAYQQAIGLSYPADNVTIKAYCEALASVIEAGQLAEGMADVERCRVGRS